MLLLLAELKVPSHGILTVGGIISFVLGAVLLMDTSVSPAIRVSWQVIIVMGVLMVLFFLFVVGASIRAHRRKVDTGEEGLRQARGHALGPLAPLGEVLVEGERWRARATSGAIAEGEEIEVVGQDGLTLLVRKRPADTATGASS
jgi:membrane-bound serine protease (ClpP class)